MIHSGGGRGFDRVTFGADLTMLTHPESIIRASPNQTITIQIKGGPRRAHFLVNLDGQRVERPEYDQNTQVHTLTVKAPRSGKAKLAVFQSFEPYGTFAGLCDWVIQAK